MMKLLVVLSIREIQDKVAKMLEKAGVEIFSVGDITGYKKRGYNVGWFGSDNGKTNSLSCSALRVPNRHTVLSRLLRNVTNAISRASRCVHTFSMWMSF